MNSCLMHSKQRVSAIGLIIGFAFLLYTCLAQNALGQSWQSQPPNNITFTGGNVGIGITNPVSNLHLSSATNGIGFYFDAYPGGASQLRFRWANGTPSAPTPVASGDRLGSVAFSGYTGGSSPGFGLPWASALIAAYASEAWSGQTGTGQGAYIAFYTTPTGSAATGGQAERMRIDASGNIGIGTTSPGALLEVEGQVLAKSGPASLALYHLWDTSGPVDARRFYFWDTGGGIYGRWVNDANSAVVAETIFLKNNGNVGIGTTTPGARLDIAGSANVSGNLTATGNATVSGNLTVTGNIAVKYQDVAEWVPATGYIPAGTVVILDPTHSNRVMPSSAAYDTAVAGVVSESPGVTLGESGAGKALVSTTGRVRVKVDATSSPIRVGDLLVTSDTPGFAMKSQPVDLGGIKMHRPGTVIGKALEPLAAGTGEILVLLALQ